MASLCSCNQIVLALSIGAPWNWHAYIAHNSGGPVYCSSLKNALHVTLSDVVLKREKLLSWSGKHLANLETSHLSGVNDLTPAARMRLMIRECSVHEGV